MLYRHVCRGATAPYWSESSWGRRKCYNRVRNDFLWLSYCCLLTENSIIDFLLVVVVVVVLVISCDFMIELIIIWNCSFSAALWHRNNSLVCYCIQFFCEKFFMDYAMLFILRYSQSFDLEGESGIVVRGIGTCVKLSSSPAHLSSPPHLGHASSQQLNSSTSSGNFNESLRWTREKQRGSVREGERRERDKLI